MPKLLELKKFSTRAREKLRCYVYLYIDPRDKKPFYVGKGTGNRWHSHTRARARNSERARRIRELTRLGLAPQIDILKYGLTKKEALLVEQTAIDLLDLESLTNVVRGHGSRIGSRGTVQMIAGILDAKPVRIREPAVLITINREYRGDMGLQELYDATRSAWKVGARRHKVKLALSVYRGVVREVFRITEWVPGGTTLKAADLDGRPKPRRDRWEFVGHVAEQKVRSRYLGRSVDQYIKPGAQNPIRYIMC